MCKKESYFEQLLLLSVSWTESRYTMKVTSIVFGLGIWSRSCLYKTEQKDLEIWRYLRPVYFVSQHYYGTTVRFCLTFEDSWSTFLQTGCSSWCPTNSVKAVQELYAACECSVACLLGQCSLCAEWFASCCWHRIVCRLDKSSACYNLLADFQWLILRRRTCFAIIWRIWGNLSIGISKRRSYILDGGCMSSETMPNSN